MKRTKKRFALSLLLPLFCSSLLAENWAQFRGPKWNGSSPETGLPATWTLDSAQVKWATDLPGASAASPIVWEDHVFISSTDAQRKMLCALCIDRTSGELLWSRDVAPGLRKDPRSNYAAPTPTTDGELVFFFYGSGHLVAFDFDGNKVWERNIQEEYGEFAFMWTFSTSPVLVDGKLIMQVLQRDTSVSGHGFEDRFNESYLLALDPKTGKEIYRHVRDSDAKAESREAFTTPVAYERDGKTELLVCGGDSVSGHDPATGAELWRWGTWNPTRKGDWRLVPSPVYGDGIVLACAPKRDPIYAVKVGGSGQLTDDALAWVSSEQRTLSSDVPTPAFADGDFFILSDVRKALSRVEPKTGKIKWSVSTPGTAKFEASPLVADGKVYIVNFNSTAVVFDATSGEQLSEIPMDEPRDDANRSSIVAAHGQLFLRTTNKLFCIAN